MMQVEYNLAMKAIELKLIKLYDLIDIHRLFIC